MSLYFTDESNRCEILALYLIENSATVRSTAANYKISKSTVHKDITARLCQINRPLYERVRTVLDSNKAQRHIRGGQATKNKYLNRKTNNEN
ncbi:MAG: sporulation transcriptional regulator SpoIIID [Clostridia bacterium]|nr:sporulation transcriptional regulator SpoIIID [Clostridia bacterium]MBQ4055085.1 sporulation transcriptional regulator SpoIIID [Clostridia bacterium]